MKIKSIAVVALAAMIAVPSMADDEAKKEKKGKRTRGGANAAAALIKKLDAVGLTEEQTKKIMELGKASIAATKKIREEAGITPELMKKRATAQKEIREAGGKKGKELIKAINEKAGLTEAQVAAFGKINESRQKLQKDVIALLTDEQKAKLPKQMQRGAKASGKGKGAAKKKAAEKGEKGAAKKGKAKEAAK